MTVLTSLDAEALHATGVAGGPRQQVLRLARLALAAGAWTGWCAAAGEVAMLRDALGAGPVLVVPGIRPAGAAAGGPGADGMTPGEAVAAGADWLVVGRPITGAADPGSGGGGRSLAEMRAGREDRHQASACLLEPTLETVPRPRSFGPVWLGMRAAVGAKRMQGLGAFPLRVQGKKLLASCHDHPREDLRPDRPAGRDAAEAADWIGFNFFARSPRLVTPARAASLAGEGGPARVGLFVEPEDAEVAAVLAALRLDALQVYDVAGAGGWRCGRGSGCRCGCRWA